MAPTPGQIRPWRYLTAFVGIVVVLYALVFFTGDGRPAPKLGIDLEGGTRVTLSARTETGAVPPRDQLLQAQQIIEQRVNGLGVSGAEVVLDGSNLTITVPGAQGDDARSLGQTAQLRFREVIGGPFPATLPEQPGATPPGTEEGVPGENPGTAPQPPNPQPPAPQPQGAGDSSGAIAPVAYSRPLQQPTPPPTPPPAPDGSANPAPADPELAAAIATARETRQSTDPAVQEQALVALDCSAKDPLRGYDDPAKPLVACNQEGTEKYLLGPAFLEGTQIESATAGVNPNGPGYVVSLTFKSEGAAIWGDYTSKNVGKNAAFVLDGEVVSAPTINSAIYGPTEISGQFTQQEAQDLAAALRYGSLPLSFEASEAETVSATLGLASLEAGLLAGMVGLAMVFLYCLFYYRILGVLTILSLVLSGVVVYAVLVLLGRWIGFTLDLAGVAGFIVAIGITADSFVIFFERLKDEMREGRTFRSAVPRGWVRARRTILTADAVSFLAAAVLYILAVGQVKGFAFTLGMSTVLDLVVVFLVTHPLVAMASHSRIFSSPTLSGLGAVAKIGAQRRRAAATAKGA
ncbi:protein translocase subunit SecD [Pseudonocardia asaccharolytica]|uniref:Protein translocase subunit SecD n=1 Tax=Pseudonocardia asaccharolytica DSM 44247 = NBRC 16224 TaxID=1123024 RepID=A0A511D2R5_9PSEU|nr:protein translocase subunit SecD [Pseudonocardia asaccharolytica]GEL19060.1 protein translocase subunit SecD [Pseudonocardia asaccharolytica DSM 44247 = NBRC 16224]